VAPVATGGGRGLKSNMETIHWLADVEKLTVLCGNFREGDKFTLDEKILTCEECTQLRNEERKS